MQIKKDRSADGDKISDQVGKVLIKQHRGLTRGKDRDQNGRKRTVVKYRWNDRFVASTDGGS